MSVSGGWIVFYKNLELHFEYVLLRNFAELIWTCVFVLYLYGKIWSETFKLNLILLSPLLHGKSKRHHSSARFRVPDEWNCSAHICVLPFRFLDIF